MESKSIPDELLVLRNQIDALDEEIVLTLAQRFSVTSQVGKLKAENELDSVDPIREQEKLSSLKTLAEQHSLNSDFVLEMFQMIFNEVVKNHRNLK